MYWRFKLENKYQLDCKSQDQKQSFHIRKDINHEF